MPAPSPARSGTGRLRNYAQMRPEKLESLREDMAEWLASFDSLTEAYNFDRDEKGRSSISEVNWELVERGWAPIPGSGAQGKAIPG